MRIEHIKAEEHSRIVITVYNPKTHSLHQFAFLRDTEVFGLEEAIIKLDPNNGHLLQDYRLNQASARLVAGYKDVVDRYQAILGAICYKEQEGELYRKDQMVSGQLAV